MKSLDGIHLNLFGIKFKIQELAPAEMKTGDQGQVLYFHHVIDIMHLYPHDEKIRTLLHEIIHVVMQVNGTQTLLKEKGIDHELITDTLANGLFCVLRANKETLREVLFD
jgi:hypothetical protein